MFRRLLLVAVFLHCLSSWARAQEAGCDASFNDLQVAGLIASNLVTTAPSIVLQTSPAGFSFRAVCLSSSGVRDRYRFVSLVVYYSLNGSSPLYGQFEFECVNSTWSATSPVLSVASQGRVILAADAPAITATVKTDCALCVNYPNAQVVDSVHHCYACTGCLQSLCFLSKGQSPLTAVTTCCNGYLQNGTCVSQCPSSYSLDGNWICEYNIFNSEYGFLVAVGIALGVGLLVGLSCCLFFTCVCSRMKTVHKKKQDAHKRSPTFSDDKTLSDLM
ncbi:hypothetical protein EMCRGX_G014934 [Ephydatia muelleri]